MSAQERYWQQIQENGTMKRGKIAGKFSNHRGKYNQRYKSNRYNYLKYTALGFFVADIILFAIMIVTMKYLSDWVLLFLRGCAGVIALIGVIVYVVYIYRINRDYVRDQYIKRESNGNQE